MSSPACCEVTPMFAHEPVLLCEVVDLVAAARPKIIVDCTVGGAGHAHALLDACPQARLFGLDRDPEAVGAARARLARFGSRATVIHERFSRVGQVLAGLGVGGVDAMLVDLGVSSHQLDTPERGFSFRAHGDLDMRMDRTSGTPALELIASMGEDELARVLRDFGEERYAGRVARAVVAERPKTTGKLAAIVRRVVPPSRDRLDPATRTFQALRVLVNDELGELDAWLAAVPAVLDDGGVAIAISFHSLEDRAVKDSFRRACRPCTCPPQLPVCVCGNLASLEMVTPRVVRPTAAECARNPRAKSARLRAARRLPRSR